MSSLELSSLWIIFSICQGTFSYHCFKDPMAFIEHFLFKTKFKISLLRCIKTPIDILCCDHIECGQY